MKPTPSMHDWLVSPTGQYMLRWEERYFHTLTEDIFGYNAVQIGLTELDALKKTASRTTGMQTRSYPRLIWPIPASTTTMRKKA